MRTDLRGLNITDEQIGKATKIRKRNYQFNGEQFGCLAAVILIISIAIGFFIGSFYLPIIVGILTLLFTSLYLLVTGQSRWRNSFKRTVTLGRLLEEVDEYNRIVKELVPNIDVIDQLEDVGNPVKVKNRQRTLSAFRSIKKNLIRALETERILRENPQFKPEIFSVDAISLFESLSLEEQTKGYARLVNDGLEVSTRLQKELETLWKTL